MTITLVTGNAGKLAEWRRLFPADITLEAASLDLDEIQSMDLEKIALDKAKRAYAELQRPVMVEDVAFGLEKLGGLPGPFMRYFEDALGKEAMWIVAGKTPGEPANATCTAVYYDGETTLVGTGSVSGVIVEPRGESGFGFDKVFQPEGHNQTFAEMGPEAKDAISHRRKAIENLVSQLKSTL